MHVTFRRGPHPFSWPELYALLGLGAAAAAFLFPYVPVISERWPSCAFHTFTGWPCGGCGFTRAFVRAAHLDLAAGFLVSPLAFVLFTVGLTASLVIAVTFAVPGLPRPIVFLDERLVRWGLPGIFLANWAYLLLVRWVTGEAPA